MKILLSMPPPLSLSTLLPSSEINRIADSDHLFLLDTDEIPDRMAHLHEVSRQEKGRLARRPVISQMCSSNEALKVLKSTVALHHTEKAHVSGGKDDNQGLPSMDKAAVSKLIG